MGVVYRARQLSLDRVVALKVIAPALTQDDAIRRRFLRESRVAASIDHPHVIPIYYTGEEDGVAYIAMRHVAGDDLRTLVRRSGPLEPGQAARIIGQVAAALDAAHAAGLVHRDVKPANILLGQGEHAYLTDFGLTKHVLSEAGSDEVRPLGGDDRLRLARADPRRARGRALGRLRARLRPALRARRAPAVHARRRRGEAVGAPLRAAAAPSATAAPGVPAALRRRDRAGARQGAGAALPVRRRPRPRGDRGGRGRARRRPRHDRRHRRRRPDRDRHPHRRDRARAAAPAAEGSLAGASRVLLAAAAAALLAAAAVAGLAMRGEGEQPRAPRSPAPTPKPG